MNLTNIQHIDSIYVENDFWFEIFLNDAKNIIIEVWFDFKKNKDYFLLYESTLINLIDYLDKIITFKTFFSQNFKYYQTHEILQNGNIKKELIQPEDISEEFWKISSIFQNHKNINVEEFKQKLIGEINF